MTTKATLNIFATVTNLPLSQKNLFTRMRLFNIVSKIFGTVLKNGFTNYNSIYYYRDKIG